MATCLATLAFRLDGSLILIPCPKEEHIHLPNTRPKEHP